MFDDEILKPLNTCKYTTIEKQLYSKANLIKVYMDDRGYLRLVAYNVSKPVSGLLLEHISKRSGYIIKGVYTVPEGRRNGYARQLLAYTRAFLGKVRHNDNLTVSGEAWRNSVEGVN